MPRWNNNHNHRGRGGGRGRGRGQGEPHRGVPTTFAPPTAAANRAPRHPYPNTNAEIDVMIQQWPEPSTVDVPAYGANGGGNVNRGNRPWRGGTPRSRSSAGTPQSLRGTDSPRRGPLTPRGRGTSRGRGRGRGPVDYGDPFSAPHRPHLNIGRKAKTFLGKDASLSDLLYAERPLLRPVKFVRATLTPFLFQDSEDVLKPAVEIADKTEASHVPTADRVSRLFHENRTASDSDSDSGDHIEDALEEIDFADMAKIRAEVDAIAQSTLAAKIDKDVLNMEEDIEEVDFADLAAIRAKVDAVEPQTTSRDETTQEMFTGVYNHINDMTRTSVADIVHDDQPSAAQQAALSAPHEVDNLLDLKPSIDISNLSNLESDTIVVEDEIPDEEAPCSSNTLPNIPVEETPPSKAPETYTTSIDIPSHPDTHTDDHPHPLFVVDTAPTRPVSGRSASEVILVDRAGHGETLGDQDEERIVYVAPHPRSIYASLVPSVPRAELPQTSMLTGKSFDLEVCGLRSPVREDDADPAMPDLNRTRTGGEAEAGKYQHLSLASLTIEPTTSTVTADSTTLPTQQPRTKATVRARKKEAWIQRQNERGQLGFGAYGAMMSEARLREEDIKERRGPRWEARRRGDSDVDWGTEDEDEDEDLDVERGQGEQIDEVDAMSDGLGGMEIDPELKLDVDAMRGFLNSMSAEGSRFVTMDDIKDEARMRQEDEEGLGGPDGSSGSECSNDDDEVEADEEEEVAFNLEEEDLIAESDGDEELSEDYDDDDQLSPGSSFQARLRKIREQSRAQRPTAETVQEISDDEEDDKPEFLPWTRSADDEAFIAHINGLIEENSQILSNRTRKNTHFRHLHEGYVDVEALQDDPEFTTPVNQKKKKGKGKQTTTGYYDAELKAQWAKDRAKKAAIKQERQTTQLLAALDPLSAPGGSGRTRTSRKAMRAAARLDPDAMRAIAPWAVVDMASLEAQIRRFVEGAGAGDDDGNVDAGAGGGGDENRNGNGNGDGNAGGKRNGKGKGNGNNKDEAQRTRPRNTLALPPMDRGMRKRVHELAAAFGIKSVSKGKGPGRYTTLIRTTRTSVKEGKIKAVMSRYGEKTGREEKFKGGRMPRHREGDEVGKEAPKIGESNIGFRMLASMGWQEGARIGGTASVGIEAPLTAVIKNSKLGLGATR